ncbi:MAG: hypothetical protein PHQ89_00085 [Bacilli bacterium]|nr:hypothetical protein [Bacilli bacterium]
MNLEKEIANIIIELKKLSLDNQNKIILGLYKIIAYYKKKSKMEANKKICEQNGHDYKGVSWAESKYIDLEKLGRYFSEKLFYSYNPDIFEELDSRFECIPHERYEILKDKLAYSDGKFYQEINLNGQKTFSQFIDLEKIGNIYWAQYEICWVRNCKRCNAEEISYIEPVEVKQAREKLEEKKYQKQYKKEI